MTEHAFAQHCLTAPPASRPFSVPTPVRTRPDVDMWVGLASSVAIEGYGLLPTGWRELKTESEQPTTVSGEALRACWQAWTALAEDQPVTEGMLQAANRAVRGGNTSGAWRTEPVYVVSGSRVMYTAPPAEQVPEMMDRYVTWLRRWGDHPLAAWWAHFLLVSIHPWEDGNGRTARLVEAHLMRRQQMTGWWASTRGNWPNRPDYYQTLGATRVMEDMDIFYSHQLRMRNLAEEKFNPDPWTLSHQPPTADGDDGAFLADIYEALRGDK